MTKATKAVAAIMLMTAVVCVAGCMKPDEPNNDDVNHEYVDLGLPSGILWATCNVGATTPEEYGDYFAWAETQPKTTYNWDTYKYCKGDCDQLTKYCYNFRYGYNGFTDTLTVLLPMDDAATAKWGSGWRTPINSQWRELVDNTTSTWTTQNGVDGYFFTANNGNSIFLPAVGYYTNDKLNGAGEFGIYWSSTLHSISTEDGCSLRYSPVIAYVTSSSRYFGCSVRPVREN